MPLSIRTDKPELRPIYKTATTLIPILACWYSILEDGEDEEFIIPAGSIIGIEYWKENDEYQVIMKTKCGEGIQLVAHAKPETLSNFSLSRLCDIEID